MEAIYYIDMDGVLAVWNQNASEEETHNRGYFLNRDAELSAIAFVRKLIDSGKKVKILSAVYEDDHSIQEKNKWLDNVGLYDVPRLFVPYGRSKTEGINGWDEFPVLIDDYTKNLREWEKAGYLSIKFMNGYNNQPKLEVVDGIVTVKADSWDGYSIDKRMSPQQMFRLVTSVAEAEAEEKSKEELA